MNSKMSAIILVGSWFIFFFPLIISNHTLYFGDNLSLRLPHAIYMATRINQGELPFWNPYLHTGIPFLADLSTAVFYPLSVAFVFLPPLTALNALTLTSFLLAGIFMYSFIRAHHLSHLAACTAATIFMFSSTLVHYTSFLNLLSSSIWLPLTLLGLHHCFASHRRRWLLLSSFSLALQILGGHPQPVYYTLMLSFAYTFALFPHTPLRSKLSLFGLSLLVALGLSAVVLLPAYELTPLTTRSHLTYIQATSDSLHPALLLRLIVPNLFDHPQQGIAWGPAWRHVSDNKGYFGITTTLLIVLAFRSHPFRRRVPMFFTLIFFTSLTLALGSYNPTYPLLFRFLPGLSQFRGPAEILLLTCFCASVIAAFAIHHLQKHPPRTSVLVRSSYLGLTLLLLSIIIYLLSHRFFSSIWISTTAFHTFERDHVIAQLASSNLIISSLLVLSTLFILRLRLILLLPLLIFVDLYVFNSQQLYTTHQQNLHIFTSAASSLSTTLTPQDRLLSYQDIAPFSGLGNYWENVTLRPPFADSYFTQQEELKLTELNRRLHHLALDWNLVYGLPSPHGYTSFLLTSYAHYLNQSNPYPLNSPSVESFIPSTLDQLSVSYILTPQGIVSRPAALPRARILDSNYSYLKPATIISDHPESIVVTTDHHTDAILVLADASYPGWHATIDGQPVPVKSYLDHFRQIDLPAGQHEIVFTYASTHFRLGLAISTATLMIVSLALLLPQRLTLSSRHNLYMRR